MTAHCRRAETIAALAITVAEIGLMVAAWWFIA